MAMAKIVRAIMIVSSGSRQGTHDDGEDGNDADGQS